MLWVAPLLRQSDLLNDAAIAAGLGKVVAHFPSCRHTVDTPVLVSTHQVYEGISSRGTPPSSNAQMSWPCAPINEIFS